MFEQVLSKFSGGEVSEEIYGQYESELYRTALRRCQNFISLTQGPVQYRAGTTHVHHTRQNAVGRQERFVYNDEQVYILEFTNAKLRIFEDASVTLSTTAKTITAVTEADPGVLTVIGHGYASGDEIYIQSVGGMTELNDRFYRVNKIDNNSFSLLDLFGNAIDTTSFTTHTSGGTSTIVYELTSPYNATELEEFHFDQEGNVAYFAHRTYAPYKLTRVSATSWTFATYSRTNDPFTTTDLYPGAVAFYEGCLYFASSNDFPDRIWRSKGPTSAGVTQYDVFTTGSSADDAIIASVSTGTSNVAYIHWLTGVQPFLAIGTEGGVLGLDGGGDAAITPTNFRIRPLDPVGVQGIMPVVDGQSIFYMQKGSRHLRSLDYYLEVDRYQSTDRQFVSSHLLSGGVKQIAIQRWKVPIVWAVRNDGVLIGATIKAKEDVSGWHQHSLGGSGEVVSISVEPQATGYDRLYLLVKRTINSTTVYYHEYMNEPFEGLRLEDYFTGEDNESTDIDTYVDALFTAQQDLIYLDSSLTYDGVTTTSITGLHHLEGETVSVLADGRKLNDETVSGGAITIDETAEVVHVGYKYKGIVIPLDFVVVGQNTTVSFLKNISTIGIAMSNTIGVKYGTSLYNLQDIPAADIGQDTDSPPVPFTGVVDLPNDDSWDENKRFVYVQDDPYPCMLNAVVVTIETGEK